MRWVRRLKHKAAMWIWKDDPWCIAIDQIKDSVMKLRSGEAEAIRINWTFTFLKTPPPNKFICDIRLVGSGIKTEEKLHLC